MKLEIFLDELCVFGLDEMLGFGLDLGNKYVFIMFGYLGRICIVNVGDIIVGSFRMEILGVWGEVFLMSFIVSCEKSEIFI